MSATAPPATREPANQETSVTIARTAEEVEALRPWLGRVENIDADIDFFLTVSSHRGLQPYVILLRRPDADSILIVARVAEQRRRLGRPVRFLQVAFGGVIGADTPTDCRLVIDTLRRALDEGVADAVSLAQVQLDGPLYLAARAGAPWWRVDQMGKQGVHWRAAVPDSLDAFLAAHSNNTRYNVRRYTKKLVRAHGEGLTTREFRTLEDLPRLHADLEAIATKTYQRGLGVGYTGDELESALMRLGATNGWLRAWVLYIDDHPVTFWFGYVYAGVFWLIATGFDPAFGELRVGQYLQVQMMESLCGDADVRAFDYGAGFAEYKRRFGDTAVDEADVLLYAPSLAALQVNAAQTLRMLVLRLGRKWIAETKTGARVKKLWRDRAASRAGARSASSNS